MGLYYYSSAVALVAYAVAVTLIVRVRSSQHPAANHSVRCNAVANGACLVAACVGPPLYLLFLVSTSPASKTALACLAAACALSVPACCCWSCWAVAAVAGDHAPQFLSSSCAQVCASLCAGAAPAASDRCFVSLPMTSAAVHRATSKTALLYCHLNLPAHQLTGGAGFGDRRRQPAAAPHAVPDGAAQGDQPPKLLPCLAVTVCFGWRRPG